MLLFAGSSPLADLGLPLAQNYEFLLRKISTWLRPNKEAKSGEALLFVHIFCHRDTPSVLYSLLAPNPS
jgi:hypothetical protein